MPQARQLFERLLALPQLHSHVRHMKTVFKKYLLFETKYGDNKSQEIVKEKARRYVEASSSNKKG